MLFKIANRNNIKLDVKSVQELRASYEFDDLQGFLDIFHVGSKVLIKKRDFYDLTMAYLKKAHQQNVLHTEIFFDPQTHTNRKIKYNTVLNGIYGAMRDAEKKWGISSKLIMCFLRDKSTNSAMSILKEALKHKKIIAVGLDSTEIGYRPSKFKKVFDYAKKNGLLTVAHVGEEGSAEDVCNYLKLLKISRIDHGNHSMDDEKLVKELAERKITLTSCPLSNYKLKVVKKMEKNPVKRMLRKGLKVTVNSDDPAYFGGYINENFQSVYDALNLTQKDIYTLAKNSFEGSFMSDSKKQMMLEKLNKYVEKNE
jgi:adenosine deaminase